MIKKIFFLTLLFLILVKGYFLATIEPLTKVEKISLSRGLAWYNKVFLEQDIPITSAPLAGIIDIFCTKNRTKIENFDSNYQDFVSYLYFEEQLNSLVTALDQKDLILVRIKNLLLFLVIIITISPVCLSLIPLISSEILLIILTGSQVTLTLILSLIAIKLLIKNFKKRSYWLASSLGLVLGLLLATKASFFLLIIILASSILTIDFIKGRLHKGFTKLWIANCFLTIFISLFTLWLIYAYQMTSLKGIGKLFALDLPDIKIIPFYEPLKNYLFSLVFPSEIQRTNWSFLPLSIITLNLLAYFFAVRFLQKEKKYYLFSQGILTSFLLIFSAFSNETKFFIDMASLQSIIYLPNFIKIRS